MDPTTAIILGAVVLAILMAKPTGTQSTPDSLEYSKAIRDFARAVATAEGYFVAGSIPAVRNNPGNLKMDGKVITTFATPTEGWNALYSMLDRIVKRQGWPSRYYRPEMTIAEMAKVYTGEAAYMNWARNVSVVLKTSSDTTIGTLLAG